MEQINVVKSKREQLLNENSITVVHNVTKVQLEDFISQTIKNQLDDLKKTFQPKEPNQYLTRNQLKDWLNVDLSTIHNWGKRKILKPYGIGGRVYYLRSEVEAKMIELNLQKK